MTIGQYKSQVDEMKKILNKCDILYNYSKDNVYNLEVAKRIAKCKDYAKLHTEIYNSGDYTFQLSDNSLLQFSYNSKPFILSYSYIPFPFEIPQYRDFLALNGLEYEEVGDKFMEDYEQEAESSDLKEHINIIRYDYSEKEYAESIHSVSHIHIGFTDMRICSEKIISPMAFLFFILKQAYVDIWKKNISNTTFNSYCRFKNKCNNVPPIFFSKKDKDELYLI